MKTMDNEQWEIDNRVKWLSKNIFAIFSLLVFSFSLSYAQVTPSPQYPWVMVRSAKAPVTTTSELNLPQNGTSTIQYLDGTGQNLQSVGVGVSPDGKDIILGVSTIDEIGRVDKTYLPVASTNSWGQFFNNVESAAQAFYNDSKPYGKVAQYEASPMSRVLKSFGPGEAFQTSSSLGLQQDYTVAGNGIRRYVITDDNTLNGSGTYLDGQLIRTVSKDEDGNELIEYKGAKSGRLIQSHRKEKGGTGVIITAYVYDFMGRLRFVVTPKLYEATTNISVGSHSEGLYIYRYDERSRLVETHKPGAGAEYTIYNELGQAVMSQNSRLRESNTWLWTKHDGHGRTIMGGTVSSPYTRTQIQAFFDNYTAPEHFEEPSTGSLLRYTNRSFPSQIAITETDVKVVSYYDQYNWVTNPALSFTQYKTPRYANATGLATGNKVRRLDTGAWMETVWYYDDQNRVIQTQTLNRNGTINQTDAVLDFEGKLQEERTIYRKPGHANITVATHYAYDHAGRQTSAIHKVDGVETPLAKYNYDEIGRLQSKYLGVADGKDYIIENSLQPTGDRDIAYRYVELQPGMYTAENGTYLAAIAPGPLQMVDYSYTIRGQLRGINLDENGNFGLQNGDVFALKLDHHETAQTYNGQLNKQSWQNKTQQTRSFTYNYDGFGRIGSATYTGIGSEDYGMPGINYDANGNITAFNRRGLNSPNNWQSIDILAFNYQNAISNQLSHIVDYGNQNVGFKDNGGFGTDYTYYPDGSLKSDANKGITLIEYNYLGLEEKIHFGSTKRIENIYDASGLKLEQRLINGSTTHTTEYIGDLIYVNNQLQTIQHNEGRVKVESGIKRYQFFLTDHLGNTRIIIERVSDTAALVQELHYGVWGEKLEGIGVDGDWNFLFQGKEYVDFEGYNIYDFHTRSYDPWTGRFNQVDPVDIHGLSGYAGMANNPLSFIDPDGREPITLAALGILLLKGAAIGAAVGGIGYTAGVGFSQGGFNNWNWGQFGRSVGLGAAGGVASAGIGSAAGAIGGVGGFAVQTAGHAAWGGLNSMWNGGDFWSGALAGGVGNIVGSATAGMGTGVQIGASALMGGISADMAGGSFWQGAAIGGIVAGANHGLHKLADGGKGKYYSKRPSHRKGNPLQEHYEEAVTLSEWMKANNGLSRDEIINQLENRSSSPLNSQQGGPRLRYVFHPKTGDVIDMRHMLIVGNYGAAIGTSIEFGQKFAGLPSGLNRQDFYSNSLGYGFYNVYNDTGARLLRFFGVGNFTTTLKGYLTR